MSLNDNQDMTPVPAKASNPKRTVMVLGITLTKKRIVSFAVVAAVFIGIKWGAEFVNSVSDLYGKVFHTSDPKNSTVVAADPNNWQPPELPKDCSIVTIFIGEGRLDIPVSVASIYPGTETPIKGMPDVIIESLMQATNYSPRDRTFKSNRRELVFPINGKDLIFPVMSVVISNRHYAEVQIPFIQERRIVYMSDKWDSFLPRLWDRNYDSNAFEVITERGNPVLQVIYESPDKIRVNGVFLVNELYCIVVFATNTTSWIAPKFVAETTDGRAFEFSGTNVDLIPQELKTTAVNLVTQAYNMQFPGQKRIFKYPSSLFMGEREK